MQPPAIYAHHSVLSHPTYRTRVERVSAALAQPRPVVAYGDEDLPRLIRDEGLLAGTQAMGTLPSIPDPILLFNTFRFDDQRQARLETLRREVDVGHGHMAHALVGAEPFAWFEDRLPDKPLPTSRLCRACWRLHFQCGCAHKCHYCHLGGLLATMVNVEDYIEHLDRLIAAHPWQETYLLEDDADVLCLEPELGCLGPLIEYFGTLEDRYLILHTKSWNVDWMLDLPHNGRTIIVWSLAGPTQVQAFEPNTGTTFQRIDAARRAQQAGYVVRYKFKPIIPVADWRKDAAEAVAELFAHTRPDVISLSMFMWTDVDVMKRNLAAHPLEPAFLAAAEAAAEEMAGVNARPFPHDVRAAVYDHYLREIRRHDAEVPVSLSTETLAMWQAFSKRLGAGPRNYVCGCGPNSIPGRRQLPCDAFAHAHPATGTQFDTY